MSENRKYFKYGGTIVVIVQGITAKGGLIYDCVPRVLSEINRKTYKEQWETLEAARDNGGGVFYTAPCNTSSFRELLAPYINRDGFIEEDGMKIVHTELHGDFCVRLVCLKDREDCLL